MHDDPILKKKFLEEFQYFQKPISGKKKKNKSEMVTDEKTKQLRIAEVNLSSEKLKFLEILGDKTSLDSNGENLENIINSELFKIRRNEELKSQLKNINLLENSMRNITPLYEWKNLLYNPRPLSNYTKYKPNKNKNYTLNSTNSQTNFENPLTDNHNLSSQTIKNLFSSQSQNNIETEKLNIKNKKFENIKKNSSSKNRKRKKYNAFNKDFSKKKIEEKKEDKILASPGHLLENYYGTQLYKNRKNNIADLGPKLKSKNKKLKKEIENQRILSLSKERKLNDILDDKDEIEMKKEDLICAADKGNSESLLRSIYKQLNPSYMEENKKYNKSIKFSSILSNVKNKKLKINKKINKSKLKLSYYDENNSFISQFFSRTKNKTSIKESINSYEEEYRTIKFSPKMKSCSNFNDLIKENDENKSNIDNLDNCLNSNKNKKDVCFQTIKTCKKEIQNDNIITKSLVNEGIGTPLNNTPKLKLSRPKTSSINSKETIHNLKLNLNTKRSSNSANSDKITLMKNFPIKLSSKVGNPSYDKINKILHNRMDKKKSNSYKNILKNHLLLIKPLNSKKKLNKKFFTINAFLDYQKQKDINKKAFQIKHTNWYSFLIHNQLSGKYYSSSYNSNVKNRREAKNKLIKANLENLIEEGNKFYERELKKLDSLDTINTINSYFI